MKNKEIKYDDIPNGFKEMGLVLTFNKKQVEIWEQQILRLIIRDYYLFYTKINKFKDDSDFIELRFFCRPKNESSITYHLGCYAQAMFGFYTKKQIIECDHTIPRNYPKEIYLNLNPTELNDI